MTQTWRGGVVGFAECRGTPIAAPVDVYLRLKVPLVQFAAAKDKDGTELRSTACACRMAA